MDIIFIVIFQVLARWNVCNSRFWLLCTPSCSCRYYFNLLLFKTILWKWSICRCSSCSWCIFVFARLHLLFLSIDEHVGILRVQQTSTIPINLGGRSVAAERIL